MFSNILIPVDGSKESLAAVKYARMIVEKLGGSITLLYVIPTGPFIDLDCSGMTGFTFSEVGKEPGLVKGLDVFEGFNGDVTVLLEYGHPGMKIVEFSKKQNCSLIVMGRCDMSAVSKVLIGSVSNYVLDHAVCPVLIICNNK